MDKRLTVELKLLKPVFPGVEYHDVEMGWFFIPGYTVQYGGWLQIEVAVCFQVPVGYPGNPPYAFWVSPPLRQAGSNSPPTQNYQEPSKTPFSGTWGKFSWSHEAGWKPTADPGTGSNLLNFVLSFRDRFREGP
jgi:hypothetical protein